MEHTIRLTRDWINPETKEQHRAGDIITLPGWFFRMENATGLQDGYSLDLTVQSEQPAKATTKRAVATTESNSTTNTEQE